MNKKRKITKEQVKHVSLLANLELSVRQLEKFQAQLAKILEYFEGLKELDTTRVEPTSQITGLENVFREDKVTSSLTQDEVLSSAKDKDKGFFKVKAIFDEI